MTENFARKPKAEALNQQQVATAKLAQELVAVLGYEGALLACQKNSWAGVRKEVTRSLGRFSALEDGRPPR